MILAIDVGDPNIVMGFIEGDTIVDNIACLRAVTRRRRSMPSSCTVCWI